MSDPSRATLARAHVAAVEKFDNTLAVEGAARVDKAQQVLGWKAELDIRDGISSALAWADKRRDLLGYA